MTLSAEQWTVVSLGGVLVLTLLVSMILTPAGLTWRRFIALLVVAACMTCGAWVLGGASVPLERDVTVVASCDTPPARIAQTIATAHGDRSVGLLLFTSGGAGTSCPAEIDMRGQTSVHAVRVLRTPDDPASMVAAMAEVRPPALSNPVAAALASVAKPTTVFLYDPTVAAWDRRIAARTDALVNAVSTMEGDVFLSNTSDAGKAYSLSVSIDPGVRPGLQFRFQQTEARLEIRGGPASRSGDLVVSLCISLDRIATLAECEAQPAPGRVFLPDIRMQRRPGPDPEWYLPSTGSADERMTLYELFTMKGGASGVNDLSVQDAKTGWQALTFRARIEASGGYDALALHPVVDFIDTGKPGPVIIAGQETVGRQAWPLPLSAATALIDTTWGVRDDTSRRTGSLPGVATVPLPSGSEARCLLRETEPDEALMRACLDTGSALVLIEPGTEILQKLTDWKFPARLAARKGAMLIVGAPAISPVQRTTVAPWMPATAKPVSGTADPQMIHGTRSIAIIADCSGLAHIPIEGDTETMKDVAAVRPVDLQVDIMDALTARINALPDTIRAPLTTGGGLIRVEAAKDWRVPSQIQLDPGCLRASSLSVDMTRTAHLVEFAGLEERLHAFLEGRTHGNTAPFAAFEAGHQYNGSVIIVFTTKAAQLASHGTDGRRGGGAVSDGKLAISYPPVPNPSILKDLKATGVKVLLVVLPTNADFQGAADLVGDVTWSEALKGWRDNDLIENPLVVPKGETADATAHRLLQYLKLEASMPSPADGVVRESYGRVLDPRFADVSEAVPSVVLDLALDPTAEVHLRGAHGSPMAGVPLIVSRMDLGVPIVQLAYSPFGPLAWASERLSPLRTLKGFRAACPNPCVLDPWFAAIDGTPAKDRMRAVVAVPSGLGIQRLIDAVEQSSRDVDFRGGLRLTDVSVGSDLQYADLQFEYAPGLKTWEEPEVQVPDPPMHCGDRATASGCPLSLVRLDTLDRTMTYRMTTDKPEGLRASGDVAQAVPATIAWQSPEGPVQVTVPMILSQRTRIAHGGSIFVNTLRITGAIRLSGMLPPARASAVTPAILMLLVMSAALFSPVVRRWHAFARFAGRHLRSLSPIAFDADTVSQRAGVVASRYEAGRRAGDPAWVRPFQSGDSLARAVVPDLACFTSLGRSLGIPRRKPRVRLREIGESFDLLVFIDDAPSMRYPGDLRGRSRKRMAAEAMIAVIGEAVTRRGGRWTLTGLRTKERVVKLKTRDPEMVSELLSVFFDTERERFDPRLLGSPPRGMEPRLLISDFLTCDVSDYIGWLGSGRGAAILIRDREQKHEVGLGYDAATGTFFDRGVWEHGDAEALLARRRIEVRTAMQQAGQAFAEIDVDASDLEISEILTTSGVLETSRY